MLCVCSFSVCFLSHVHINHSHSHILKYTHSLLWEVKRIVENLWSDQSLADAEQRSFSQLTQHFPRTVRRVITLNRKGHFAVRLPSPALMAGPWEKWIDHRQHSRGGKDNVSPSLLLNAIFCFCIEVLCYQHTLQIVQVEYVLCRLAS